ncbi:hypothetical protein [Fusobacterium sp.]|uniref:hypothetical protein n=1 Tax=Fusobacterium sp. TaxID=68766 RepID=UPI002628F6FE|nr:hypothetical protein [Fusobacterium sp.]
MKVKKNKLEKFISNNEDIIVTAMELLFKMVGYSIVTAIAVTVVFTLVSMILIFSTYPIA